MSGVICFSNNNSRQYFLHITPTRAVRYEDKIVEEVEGREAVSRRKVGEKAASSRLCIFAVNTSRSVPSRERDPTKPALFELSFASHYSLSSSFSFE